MSDLSQKLWDEVDTMLRKVWSEVGFMSVQDAIFEASRLADIERYKDLDECAYYESITPVPLVREEKEVQT